ncbi:hypothetical protein BKA93DRAFT_374482 [Sparassis latifolia]
MSPTHAACHDHFSCFTDYFLRARLHPSSDGRDHAGDWLTDLKTRGWRCSFSWTRRIRHGTKCWKNKKTMTLASTLIPTTRSKKMNLIKSFTNMGLRRVTTRRTMTLMAKAAIPHSRFGRQRRRFFRVFNAFLFSLCCVYSVSHKLNLRC